MERRHVDPPLPLVGEEGAGVPSDLGEGRLRLGVEAEVAPERHGLDGAGGPAEQHRVVGEVAPAGPDEPERLRRLPAVGGGDEEEPLPSFSSAAAWRGQ